MVDLERTGETRPSKDEKVDGVVLDTAEVRRRPDNVDRVPHASFFYLSRVKGVETAREGSYAKGTPDPLPDKIVYNAAKGADLEYGPVRAAIDVPDMTCQKWIDCLQRMLISQ